MDRGRVVALDYGRRRIGVAVSDPTRTIASPHEAVANDDPPTEPPQRLLDLLAELEPTEVVVGIPLLMDGTEGEMAAEARAFGRRLGERTGIPVAEWDERLSTAAAERELRRTASRRMRREDKGLPDMVAAALLLRSYLERAGGP